MATKQKPRLNWEDRGLFCSFIASNNNIMSKIKLLTITIKLPIPSEEEVKKFFPNESAESIRKNTVEEIKDLGTSIIKVLSAINYWTPAGWQDAIVEHDVEEHEVEEDNGEIKI